MPVKNIIFDLDDTIVDSTRAYDVALRSVGLSLKHPAYLRARESVKRRLGDKHVNSHNRLLYFKEMMGKDLSADHCLRMMNAYERALSNDFKRQAQALGRTPLFKKLSRTYTLLILSNENTRTQLIKLNALDPDKRFFKDLVTSEDVGAEKPDRRMFRAAIARLRSSVSNTVMVGDNLDDDIKPALALGMKAVWTHEFLKDSSNRSFHHKNLTVISKLEYLTWALQ